MVNGLVPEGATIPAYVVQVFPPSVDRRPFDPTPQATPRASNSRNCGCSPGTVLHVAPPSVDRLSGTPFMTASTMLGWAGSRATSSGCSRRPVDLFQVLPPSADRSTPAEAVAARTVPARCGFTAIAVGRTAWMPAAARAHVAPLSTLRHSGPCPKLGESDVEAAVPSRTCPPCEASAHTFVATSEGRPESAASHVGSAAPISHTRPLRSTV